MKEFTLHTGTTAADLRDPFVNLCIFLKNKTKNIISPGPGTVPGTGFVDWAERVNQGMTDYVGNIGCGSGKDHKGTVVRETVPSPKSLLLMPTPVCLRVLGSLECTTTLSACLPSPARRERDREKES